MAYLEECKRIAKELDQVVEEYKVIKEKKNGLNLLMSQYLEQLTIPEFKEFAVSQGWVSSELINSKTIKRRYI